MGEKRKTICFKLYLDKQYAAKNLRLNFLLSFNILFCFLFAQLSGEILPQRKLPRTVTLRNISSEIGLIKYIFDVASFEEDLTNRV